MQEVAVIPAPHCKSLSQMSLICDTVAWTHGSASQQTTQGTHAAFLYALSLSLSLFTQYLLIASSYMFGRMHIFYNCCDACSHMSLTCEIIKLGQAISMGRGVTTELAYTRADLGATTEPCLTQPVSNKQGPRTARGSSPWRQHAAVPHLAVSTEQATLASARSSSPWRQHGAAHLGVSPEQLTLASARSR